MLFLYCEKLMTSIIIHNTMILTPTFLSSSTLSTIFITKSFTDYLFLMKALLHLLINHQVISSCERKVIQVLTLMLFAISSDEYNDSCWKG